jgi:hypothetical protein
MFDKTNLYRILFLIKQVINKSTLSLALIDLGCIKICFSNFVSNRHGLFDDLSADRRIRAIFG